MSEKKIVTLNEGAIKGGINPKPGTKPNFTPVGPKNPPPKK